MMYLCNIGCVCGRHFVSLETRAKLRSAHIGKKHSVESKEKMRKAQTGSKNHNWGKKFSDEHRKKISVSNTGKVHKGCRGRNASNWKGGVTPVNQKIRNSPEYLLWRREVFKRDKYICQSCGIKNGSGKSVKLNADHIKPFSLFPELRFEIDNGRTLCVTCHRKTDSFGSKLLKNYVYRINKQNGKIKSTT